MHKVVAFAKPFRMPDFFMISGLFLARVIDRDWRTYLDRKVVHFAYFYVLWVTIQFAFKSPRLRGPPRARRRGLHAISRRSSSRSARCGSSTCCRSSSSSPSCCAACARHACSPVAAALEIAPIDTGWTVPDEFAARFVYFYMGYCAGAADLPRWPPRRRRERRLGTRGLGAVGAGQRRSGVRGYAGLPVVSLALGFLGACAQSSPSPRCSPTSRSPNRSATAARTPSSSTWRSSCRC